MRIKVRRIKNKGLKEVRDKKNLDLILRRSEFQEETWIDLVDRYGHLRCWTTAAEMQRWVLEKGYTILEAEGIDGWFVAQTRRDTYRFQDMIQLKAFIENEVKRNAQLESYNASKNAMLKGKKNESPQLGA